MQKGVPWTDSIQTSPVRAHLMTLALQASSMYPADLSRFLSSEELMVSTSTQACQPWALATFRLPSAHHVLWPHSRVVTHYWRVPVVGSQAPATWQPFTSCLISQLQWSVPIQAHGHFFTIFILSTYPISEDGEAILQELSNTHFHHCKVFLYCHIFSICVPDYPLTFSHHCLSDN